MSTKVPITDATCSSQCFLLVRERGRSRPAVACSVCAAVVSHGSVPGVPAEVLANNFRRRGWEIDKKHTRAVCPRCQESDSMKMSPDAIRAQAKLIGLLEQHYDQDRRRYREGWTDARMASECGLAEGAVATHREALYGAMVPSEVLEAEAELRSIEKRLDELQAFVTDELRALREQHGRAMAKVQGALG